eukprot:gene8439-9340_t
MAGARYWSTLDAASAYWSMPLHKEDKKKTAFSVQRGKFEFNVTPYSSCMERHGGQKYFVGGSLLRCGYDHASINRHRNLLFNHDDAFANRHRKLRPCIRKTTP